jgi:hypothetical protein
MVVVWKLGVRATRYGVAHTDHYSNTFAVVIPTPLYDLTNEEFATVATTNVGLPNPFASHTWASSSPGPRQAAMQNATKMARNHDRAAR